MKFKVKSAQWKDKHAMMDLLMRMAAIESLRKHKRDGKSTVSTITEVSVGKKRRFFNSYFLLKDAGFHEAAKSLKTKLLTEHKLDISKEPEYSDEN